MKVYQDRFGSELKLEVGQFGREAVYQSWEAQGVNMTDFKGFLATLNLLHQLWFAHPVSPYTLNFD